MECVTVRADMVVCLPDWPNGVGSTIFNGFEVSCMKAKVGIVIELVKMVNEMGETECHNSSKINIDQQRNFIVCFSKKYMIKSIPF